MNRFVQRMNEVERIAWMLGGAPLVILPAALALALVHTTQHLVDDGGSAP